MTDALSNCVPPRSRRNWWKIGFFIVLILFEFAREIAVLEGAQPAQPAAVKTIYDYGGYVTASGRWIRSDGGSQIVPGTVTIDCRKETGQCVEASVSTSDEYFFPPELDWFDATFTPEGVSYINDTPTCARYVVKIDLAQKRAFATRDRKANPSNEICAKWRSA